MASNYQIVADLVLDNSSIKTEVRKVQDLVNTGSEVSLTFQQANLILSKTTDILRSMVDQVYELDSSLTEFKKVSDLSDSALSGYVDTLTQLGKTVARTGSEMVQAATEFKKSGYTEEESAQLAQIASMYQNIADTEVSASEAAASIISQLKAFGYEADNAITIISAYNEVANQFAIGTNDISNALEIAGAGMAVYGNEFQEVVGLVTAGTEIMVGRSAQVARGLLAVAQRITTNQDLLRSYGIVVEDANGNLKSTYEVLAELKPVWDAMTDAERTSVGTALAG